MLQRFQRIPIRKISGQPMVKLTSTKNFPVNNNAPPKATASPKILIAPKEGIKQIPGELKENEVQGKLNYTQNILSRLVIQQLIAWFQQTNPPPVI
jgi:hypothetical protein